MPTLRTGFNRGYPPLRRLPSSITQEASEHPDPPCGPRTQNRAGPRTSIWRGRSKRWRRTSGSFGTPLFAPAAPSKPSGFRDPGFYADGWAGVAGWVLANLLGGRPTSHPSSRVSLCVAVGACPARSPARSSGAGVRSYSARPGSSAASVLSTGPVLLASAPPYHHDLEPTYALL